MGVCSTLRVRSRSSTSVSVGLRSSVKLFAPPLKRRGLRRQNLRKRALPAGEASFACCGVDRRGEECRGAAHRLRRAREVGVQAGARRRQPRGTEGGDRKRVGSGKGGG